MNDPHRPFHEPVELHIGGQTRTFVLGHDSYRRAQRALGGTDPREALARGGIDPVCIVAACARHHDDKKTSDKTIERWITVDPTTTVPLIEAVAECVRRYLVAAGMLEGEG
jgi:hypothetical protein